MKKIIWPLIIVFISGCTPKLGKDFVVEIDKNNVSIENSSFELISTSLSFTGIPLEKTNIKIKGFVNVENKWWKSIEVKNISYELFQNDEVIAKGNGIIEGYKEIKSGEKTSIPLTLNIDSKSITKQKMAKRLLNIDNLEVKGTVTVTAFGKDFETKFKNKINK